uniref:cytochrome P450 2C21-like isoform X2 n=1 Tax=Styela clava TaxID=7725 RepID=UPI00193A1A14|nr:cytochrome P450 2C21-like isoform X2 [Styela clava]
MIAIFTIILICLLSMIYLRKHKKKNLPPGPTGLPIIGYMPFLNKNPALTYTELAKDYGPVFSVQIGTEHCVVLNSRDAIHEALIKNGRLTANRPRIKLLEEINYGLSITFNGGPVWKRQRMFALKTIKGFSKQMIEDKILEEISYLCEDLSKTGDEEIDCQNLLANMTANVMINIFMGFRFPHNDKELGRITSVVTIFSDVGILFLAPFLRHFSIFKKAYSSMLSGFFFLQGKIKSIIEKRQNSSDKKEEYSDFLNKYLDEMNNGQDESFTMRQLIIIIQDILGAGTDTASTSILWCLFALAVFPECQDKISEELNNAIVPAQAIKTILLRPRQQGYNGTRRKTSVHSSFHTRSLATQDSGTTCGFARNDGRHDCSGLQYPSKNYDCSKPLGCSSKSESIQESR